MTDHFFVSFPALVITFFKNPLCVLITNKRPTFVGRYQMHSTQKELLGSVTDGSCKQLHEICVAFKVANYFANSFVPF